MTSTEPDFDEAKAAEIRQTSQKISRLLSLIPTDVYLHKDVTEDSWKHNRFAKYKTKPAEDKKKKEILRKAKFDPTLTNKSLEEFQQEAEDQEDGEEKITEKTKPKKPLMAPLLKPNDLAKTPQELKERLHERIDEFKKKRKADETKDKSSESSENKKKKVKKDNPKKEKSDSSDAPQPPKKVELNLQFSNMEVSKTADQPKKHKSKIMEMKKILKKQEYVESIKDTEEGQKMIESNRWRKVEQLAQGVKVKDNPALIKKTLKKKEKKKQQSSKKWAERIDTANRAKQTSEEKKNKAKTFRKEGKQSGGAKSGGFKSGKPQKK